MVELPELVRQNIGARGAAGEQWLRELPELIATFEREWGITTGAVLDGGTAAVVVEALTADRTPVVLKLALPDFEGAGDFGNEITMLRLLDGDGCARLLRFDEPRRTILLERLGQRLVDLGLPQATQLEIICATVAKVWRRVPLDVGLPTLAEKGPWFVGFIERTWEALDRPCAVRTVDRAIEFAQRRAAAFDPDNALLLHGDAHQWNTLEAGDGFKLIDPDGVIGEREYDLAIPMRESHEELLAGDPLLLGEERCRLLGRLTGLDPAVIWEWGLVERVATGLLCMLEDRKREWGRPVLEVADAWALADHA